jgi:hypothetical protein
VQQVDKMASWHNGKLAQWMIHQSLKIVKLCNVTTNAYVIQE